MNNSVSNINKERYATEVQEFGHHGEILQGVFEGDDGKLHRGLITLKCKLFSSTAIYVRTKDPNIVSVMPEKKKKALVAAASTLKYIGKNIKYGGYLILQSNMPEEMGFGSSTCDVTASIKAVASSFNISLSPYEIANIAVNSERASDAIMFDECVLFAQREGEILERYQNTIPPMNVIGFSTDANGIDTLKYIPAEYSEEEIKTFKVLRGLFRKGIEEQDPNLIAKVATASALINQKYLPKTNFDRLLEIAEKTSALGIQVAHSGTLVGILYSDGISIDDKLIELKKYLSEIKIENVWHFNTKESY